MVSVRYARVQRSGEEIFYCAGDVTDFWGARVFVLFLGIRVGVVLLLWLAVLMFLN